LTVEAEACARPLPSSIDTPRTRAAQTSVAAVRRRIRTEMSIGDALHSSQSLVQ
jgi:hypothetical protein